MYNYIIYTIYIYTHRVLQEYKYIYSFIGRRMIGEVVIRIFNFKLKNEEIRLQKQQTQIMTCVIIVCLA